MSITLKFRHQDFQEQAAASVCSIFSGQPFSDMQTAYTLEGQQTIITEILSMWGNSELQLDDTQLLSNLQAVQRDNELTESDSLDGHNFTIEMETGTGKTYTYIKTIYELNRLYGWTKFVVVVPSIAIREGVYKTFQITEEHFMQDYGQRADYFIYNSANLSQIRQFTMNSGICIMIINSQAFNARDSDSRRITQEIDQFGSRKPIDAIASVRPILIIDEPQSVEGERTKEALKKFAPLFTLRYSATPREYYNRNRCASPAYREEYLRDGNQLEQRISFRRLCVPQGHNQERERPCSTGRVRREDGSRCQADNTSSQGRNESL